MGPIRRGDVRLCTFPSPDKTRPVVVVTPTRLAAVLQRVTVVPVTSTVRGVETEVALDARNGLKGPCVANLLNVVTIPKRSLGPWLGALLPTDHARLCQALALASGCDEDP